MASEPDPLIPEIELWSNGRVRDVPTTQYADSDGVSIAYQVVGDGERDQPNESST